MVVSKRQKQVKPPKPPSGWDDPGGTWHWFSGDGPVCGSDTPSSRLDERRSAIPTKADGKVCKRCRKKRSN